MSHVHARGRVFGVFPDRRAAGNVSCFARTGLSLAEPPHRAADHLEVEVEVEVEDTAVWGGACFPARNGHLYIS